MNTHFNVSDQELAAATGGGWGFLAKGAKKVAKLGSKASKASKAIKASKSGAVDKAGSIGEIILTIFEDLF